MKISRSVVVGVFLFVAAIVTAVALTACAPDPIATEAPTPPPSVPAMVIERDAQGLMIALRVNDEHGELVATLRPDGSVEVAKDVPQDEAARLFWAALSGYVHQCSKL